MKKLLPFFLGLFLTSKTFAQEVLLANYFDIATNETAGTSVTGKVNLKR